MPVDFAGGTDSIVFNDIGVIAGPPAPPGAIGIRFKSTSASANVLMFAAWRPGNSREGPAFLLNNTAGKCTAIAYGFAGNAVLLTSTTTVNDGNEHLAVFNYNGSNGAANSLWIDGNQEATGNSSQDWTIGIEGTAPITLGKNQDAFWASFVGTVFELAMWNRQLAGAEIAALQLGFSMGRVAYDKVAFHAPLIGTRNNRYNAALTTVGTTISAAKRKVNPYFA